MDIIDGLQPVTADDFKPADFSDVQGGATSIPTVQDNPNPATNGEIPAPEPAPTLTDMQPVTADDFAEPGMLDKIKTGFESVNKSAGQAADSLVRPFITQAGIDAAPQAIHDAGSGIVDKMRKIDAAPVGPGYAMADMALGGDPDRAPVEVLKDIGSRSASALGAGLGKAEQTGNDIVALGTKIAGVAPLAADAVTSIVKGTPVTTSYDWWAKSAIQPSVELSERLGQQSDVLAEKSGAVGKTMQLAGAVGSQLGEMAVMGPEEGAAALAGALPREGFAGGYDAILHGMRASAHYSAIPAVMNAAKSYDTVYQQTGDPAAAVKAGIMSGNTTWLVNMLPLSVSGPLAYKMFTAGTSGMIGSEAARQLNNAALPDNMQEPFSWKGTLQSGVTMAAVGGVFASREAEDYQTAYLRYNGIQKAAGAGNAGARKTADVIDTLSQVTNNIDNAMVDSAVHGVTLSDVKMAKTHEQLQAEDPRYASIFKATQNGPGSVDPATGEQIARDAYASEVAINAAFDHYTKLSGQKNQSIQLAKNAAVMMQMAHKVVPMPELDILSRWAAYDQPSQLQFNQALQATIEGKSAPDYVHDRFGADYDPDGVANESAYARDKAARPDTFDAFYAPNPKVEKALQDGGIRYYRMKDGRLAIRGHTPQYTTNVFSHIYDTTGGIVPLTPGEKYVQETEVRHGNPAAGSEGQQAVTGSEAAPVHPERQQDGHEGNGQGERAGSVVGHEGTGPVAEAAQAVTPRAVPVTEALAKAGLEGSVSGTGRVAIAPDASDAQALIDATATDAAEHPDSVRKPLTDKQRATGNYPVAKVMLESAHGDVPVDIENPVGSIRRSLPGAPKKFSQKMIDAHYGRIPGTISADGEPLDVFLTRNAHDDSRPVAVISQHDPATGKFDELKVVMGAKTKGEALSIYSRQYPSGMVNKLAPEGKRNVVMMSREKFVQFIHSGATDVPPHPVSGAPMLKLRENGEFTGHTGDASMKDTADKVAKINAKRGVNLTYDRANDTITGTIPAPKAAAIHRSLSRLDGYLGSDLNGKAIGQRNEAPRASEAGAPTEGTAPGNGERVGRVQRSGGQEAVVAESPRVEGTDKAVSDAPIFHEGHSAHPVSAVGVHYSNTPDLTELDPTMAGTGSAGGERRGRGMGRFGNSGDPMDAMTSFYVRNGKELPAKESVVAGNHPYEARLNNLYDIATDPDGILKEAAENGTSANRDLIMETIHDHGYDGFLYDALPGQPEGKVATIFGVHGKIPVKDVGTAYLAKGKPERRVGLSEREERAEKRAKLKDKLLEKSVDTIKERAHERAHEVEGEPHFMFAGEKAVTGDKPALDLAKSMEATLKADGKTDSEIEAQLHGLTGWSRGADGKWRFEINDSKSLLRHEAFINESKLGKELRADKGVPVGDVLRHDALFTAYPNLAKDVRVKIDRDMPEEMNAAFDPDTNTIIFHDFSRYKKTGDESVLSIIHHELQHAVQAHEEHATGGNPFEFLGPMRQQKERLGMAREPLLEKLQTISDRYFAEKDALPSKEDLAAFDPEAKKLVEQLDAIDDLTKKMGLGSYQSMMNVAYKKYMRVAGEVEAYNTQERLAMTDAERRAMPPSFTEKYPRLEQIVRFGKDTIAAHFKASGQQPSALFEVAPDPHNTELTERFTALSPERRTQITHDLNTSITPDILKAVGIKADHFVSTFGGYEDQVNPSLGAQFRDGISKEDAYRAASAAGHVFNQDSVIVQGEGMGDKVGFVRIDMPGAKDYDAISRLYGQLRKDLGDKVSGFTGHDTGIDILNFNKDVDTAALKDDIKASLAKLTDGDVFHVEHGETEAHFISKEANDDGESYRSWLQSKPENEALDDLRGRATAQLEEAIGRQGGKQDRAAEVAARAEEVTQRRAEHHAAVQAQVHDITKAWKGAPPIHVVADRAEVPESTRSYLDHFMEPGENPAGVYHNGHVYVFSHALAHPDDVGATVLHEVVGHFGLHSDRTFGRDLPKLLDDIYRSVKHTPAFKRIAKQYARQYGQRAQGHRDMAEEYLAHVAESGKDPTTVQKLVAFVHDVMRKMGMKPKWSESDIVTMMAHVARGVREGRISDRGLESPQTTFDAKDFTSTSSYRGAAGEGDIVTYRNGSRSLRIGELHATVEASILDGRIVNSARDLAMASPGALRALADFTHEEGRAGVAVGKTDATKAQIEASGVPYVEHPGFYELTSSGIPHAAPMYSLRAREHGDAEEERILSKAIDHSTLQMTPWDRLQKATRDFRDDIQQGDTALELKQSYLDAGASIEKRERHLNGGLLLDAAQSAYKAFWMAKNNEQITAGVLKTGVPQYVNGSFVAVPGRKAFIDMLAPLYQHTPNGKPLDYLFEGYAVAHRANELIGQTNPDGTPKEKLLTQPEIDKLMALDQKYPQFKKVLADIQTFNHQLLDLAVDRGSMSREVADRWKQNMYVPFYRSMAHNEATSWRGRGGKSISGKKVTSKRIYGSDKKVEPVIENIIKNTSAILDKIYSNEAMRRIVAVSDGIGMERVKMPMQAIRMSADELIDQLAKAGIQVDKANLTQADLDTLTTMFRPQKPIGPDIVSVVENGKNIYYRVTDPLLYRSVTAFNDIGRFDKIMDALLGGAKRLYTVGTTLDPRFMFRIMMKDMQQSWIQTGTNPNMFKHMMSNAKDIMTDSDFLNQLRVAGYNGNEYYKIDEVRDLMEKLGGQKWGLLNTPEKLWHAYKHIGWMSEQMSRLTIAKHTLDIGGSMAEAAWQGQNTLNWQKRGDGRMAQIIMRGAPFLNAHMQGLSRLYDGMLGRDVTLSRPKAVTSFFIKGLSMMLPTLALQLYNEGNPDYERLPDMAKDLYWHVFIGGKHYVIPKPFEAGAMFAAVPERVLRVLQGRDTKRTFVSAMGDVLGEMFGLDPLPQVALPVLEDVANRQQLSSDIPIVSQHLRDLQPGAQKTATTSPAVAAIANAMPEAAPDMLRSPLRLQHLIRGYTSSIGLYALQLADGLTRATGMAPPAPASRFGSGIGSALAHIGNVEIPATDRRNRYIDEVYSAQNDADAAAKTIRDYIKQGNLDDAREVMQNNKTALQYRNELHSISGKLGQLRTLEQQVTMSPSLTPAEKRSKLDDINRMRTRMLDRAAPMLDLVNDFH